MDTPLPLQLCDEVEQEFVELGGDSEDESVQMIGKDGGNTKSKGSSTAQTSRKRKRKLTSNVRQYFDLLPIGEDGKERCKCKKCGRTYLFACKYGIGNLKKHIEKCPRIDIKDVEEYIIEQSTGWSTSTRSRSFNQEKFRELLVNAIIKHDLPLSFVEYEGVRATFSYLQPDVSHISRNMCKVDLKWVHTEYIAKIIVQLKQCPSRICLTLDCWSSITTAGYINLTAHYIDKNWVLQKRVLNFLYMPPSYSGVALAKKIYNLVVSWGIEKKLFSITLDGAFANNSCVELLKSQLNLQKCLVDSGSLFRVNCCAYILNLIVREGLKEIDESVEKVRECVKYVEGSPTRKQKFLECVVHAFLDSKRSLKQDVPTRWKSTYLMLSNGLYYKLAFCHIRFIDSNFKHNLSGEEWEEVKKICSFLKLFYDATDEFSSVKNPTSNLYFLDVFFIQLKLMEEMKKF